MLLAKRKRSTSSMSIDNNKILDHMLTEVTQGFLEAKGGQGLDYDSAEGGALPDDMTFMIFLVDCTKYCRVLQ